jgi:hypothetical protein
MANAADCQCANKLDTGQLLELYKLKVNKYMFHDKAHHDGVTLYTGMVTTILGATIVGVLQAERWWQYLVLLVGPILLCVVCDAAEKASLSQYRILMDEISEMAKIEQLLGLTRPGVYEAPPDGYWQNEPIVASRHLTSRVGQHQSGSFVWDRVRSRQGMHGTAKRLYRGVKTLSYGLAAALVGLAGCQYVQRVLYFILRYHAR